MYKTRMMKKVLDENALDMLDKFWVKVRESGKLILVQIHHKEFVCWSQISFFWSELAIKVAHILSMTLQKKSFDIF